MKALALPFCCFMAIQRGHFFTGIIKSLPKADIWPPLSREMFAICNNHKNDVGPDFEYSDRILHFGVNLKSVEYEWGNGKNK